MADADSSEDLSWLLQVQDPTANNEVLTAVPEDDLDERQKCQSVNFMSHSTEVPSPVSGTSAAICKNSVSESSDHLIDEFEELQNKSRLNQETVRKLRLVKTYKQKNDLKTLEKLISKWKNASQLALDELLQFAPKQPSTTMEQLIGYLGIDPQLVDFNPSNQSFAKDVALK